LENIGIPISGIKNGRIDNTTTRSRSSLWIETFFLCLLIGLRMTRSFRHYEEYESVSGVKRWNGADLQYVRMGTFVMIWVFPFLFNIPCSVSEFQGSFPHACLHSIGFSIIIISISKPVAPRSLLIYIVCKYFVFVR
jgi:hypothetical protein